MKKCECPSIQEIGENSMIKRTERGWAGHFIGSHDCRFRRNTLLEKGEVRVVVSTVGMYYPLGRRGRLEIERIGWNRLYETMAFMASFDEKYWDANVSREVHFTSPWTLDIVDDNCANDMHEAVVTEITQLLMADQVRIRGN